MLDKIKVFNISKDSWLIAFKLLHDLLFILLIFFAAILIAEGLLPGIISNRFGLYKIIWPILLTVIGITFIAKAQNIQAEKLWPKKTTYAVVAFFALLVINSLIRINIFFISVIFLAVAAAGYYIYKILLEDN
jgi:hypothetical protein